MELSFKPNLNKRGRMIRTGLGISLLCMALFPPSALRTSKRITLLASIGTLSLVEAALGYCVCEDVRLTKILKQSPITSVATDEDGYVLTKPRAHIWGIKRKMGA